MKLIKWLCGIFTLIIALFFIRFKIQEQKLPQPAKQVNAFTVDLPNGGRLTYQSIALKRIMIGPADSMKRLIWKKKDGQLQEYPISSIGGGYGEVEFRIRADGNAVWLVDCAGKKVAATLNLINTRFTASGGVMYWGDFGYSDSETSATPKWATLTGGKSLGRKKF